MKIAVASGKGGTGKTFVSTNLFNVARKEGITVTIVDCDAEEPNVSEFISGETINLKSIFQNVPVFNSGICTFCGKCQEYCNYHAIICIPQSQTIKVIEDLCHDCGACIAACEAKAITEKSKLVGKINTIRINNNSTLVESSAEIGIYSPVPVIKKAIKEADDKNLIILDSPPGISCPFIATVEDADYVVLVTEPTPFGLNDLKLSAETLMKIKKPFGVIINRSGLGNREVYKWLNENNISLLMEIPFDKEIAKVYSNGKILTNENLLYKKRFTELLENINQQSTR